MSSVNPPGLFICACIFMVKMEFSTHSPSHLSRSNVTIQRIESQHLASLAPTFEQNMRNQQQTLLTAVIRLVHPSVSPSSAQQTLQRVLESELLHWYCHHTLMPTSQSEGLKCSSGKTELSTSIVSDDQKHYSAALIPFEVKSCCVEGCNVADSVTQCNPPPQLN